MRRCEQRCWLLWAKGKPLSQTETEIEKGGVDSVSVSPLCLSALVLSHFEFEGFRTVMPAQAGIQGEQAAASGYAAWIPAFAGMTQHSSTPQNHHDRVLDSVGVK